MAVEAEGAHAVNVVSFGNRRRRLHRVHETQHSLRAQGIAHQPHFGDAGGIVMGDPRIPQRPQQIRRGVRLYRIQRLARKLLYEETGGARGGLRAIENYGFVGRKSANYSRCVRMDVQFKGPPIGLAARTIWTKLPCVLEVPPKGRLRGSGGSLYFAARESQGKTAPKIAQTRLFWPVCAVSLTYDSIATEL